MPFFFLAAFLGRGKEAVAAEGGSKAVLLLASSCR